MHYECLVFKCSYFNLSILMNKIRNNLLKLLGIVFLIAKKNCVLPEENYLKWGSRLLHVIEF